MRKIYILLTLSFLLLFQNLSFAQIGVRTHSNVFLTPEVGITFSDADISTRTSWGLGLKLGYTVAKYRPVELDIRGRIFAGGWKGQNFRNSDLTNYTSGVYANPATNYKDSLGYTIRNYHAFNMNFALEGVLRFNVDPSRKFAPYIFGGIASSVYSTSSNLRDKNGNLYYYDKYYIPKNKSEFDAIHDKSYETHMNTGAAFTGNIGLGFSYNINDGVRVGLEHTMSLTNKDNFDGYIGDKAFRKNDTYHFTTIYAQFYLKHRKKKERDVYTQTPPPCVSPTVKIINPSRQNEVVERGSYYFYANATNVTNKNDILITLNGQPVYDFNFNAKNGNISTTQNLTYGTNIITITARNSCGSAQQTSSVMYQRKVQQPPVVYFTNPAESPYTTNQANFNLEAKALYVNGKNNVTFKQDGVVNNNFSFDNTSKTFTSYVMLNPGNNVFEITGRNEDGVASATTIIIYGRKVECQSPVISMKQPQNNPEYSNSKSYTIIGSVYNVTSRNQIQIKRNGNSFSSFTFNPSTQTFDARLLLTEGNNTIEVTATNECGTTSNVFSINYTERVAKTPPTVSFITPYQANTVVNSENYTFEATTTNITLKGQVKVNFNGNNITNFTFDPSSQKVSFNAPLISGNNSATITVTNNDGTDVATTNVLYRQAKNPPTVTFTSPNNTPNTVYNNSYKIVAATSNITNKNQITFTVNGNATNLFAFNPSSNEFTYDAVLQEGANNFTISVKNQDGSSSDQTTIIYRKMVLNFPPTVQFTSPSSDVNVKINNYNLIAKTTNVEQKSQITVTQNGAAITNFAFDKNKQEVTFSSSLKDGVNTYIINVSTNGGKASDQVKITYNREIVIPSPTVKWSNPATPGGNVLTVLYKFKAITTNVFDKKNISITLNNSTVSTFDFNSNTGEVSFLGKLNLGNNQAKITVSNATSNVSATTSLIYTRPQIECLNPVVSIQKEAGMVNQNYTVKGTAANINNAQQLQVFVNERIVNNAISFNANTKAFSVAVSLLNGGNVVEVRATNDCGTVSDFANFTVETCNKPEVSILQPTPNLITYNTTVDATFGVINVANKNEITVKANGKVQNFTFDPVNNRASSTITLVNGNNNIEVTATNKCGTSTKSVTLAKKTCNKPTISVQSVSTENNGWTYNKFLSLKAHVNYIDNNQQIKVTNNNKNVNFVFNATTKELTLDMNGNLGTNTIVITLTNSCGSTSYTHKYSQREDPNAKLPVLTFTKPSTAETVEKNTYSFSVNSQYVTEKGQLAVKVNGQSVAFNFNTSNKTITFNGTLKEGTNTATVYAVTPHGATEESATVKYVKPVADPIITITSHACPIQLALGNNTISGYVTNVSKVTDVKFYVDGQQITNVTTSISGDKVTFSYVITARSTNITQFLKITAQNTSKTVTKTCAINYPKNTNDNSGSNIKVNTSNTKKLNDAIKKAEEKKTTTPDIKIQQTEIKKGNLRRP